MKRSYLFRMTLLVVIGLALLAAKPSPPFDAFPVRPNTPVFGMSGWVTWHGKPVPKADVFLYPLGDRSPQAWPNGFPRATAAEDGSFAVTTFTPADGAPVGRYAILVRYRNLQVDRDDEGWKCDRFAGRFMNPLRPACVVEVVSPGPVTVRVELPD